MIILRNKDFSGDLEQREFNSKAAKALNTKYLKKVAAREGIPVYKSEGYKTVEIPEIWKKEARLNSGTNTKSAREDFNAKLTNKPAGPFPASSGPENKKWRKEIHLGEYDHGGPLSFNNKKTGLYLRKDLVTAAKKERLGK